jgi:hypothetical protein
LIFSCSFRDHGISGRNEKIREMTRCKTKVLERREEKRREEKKNLWRRI